LCFLFILIFSGLSPPGRGSPIRGRATSQLGLMKADQAGLKDSIGFLKDLNEIPLGFH